MTTARHRQRNARQPGGSPHGGKNIWREKQKSCRPRQRDERPHDNENGVATLQASLEEPLRHSRSPDDNPRFRWASPPNGLQRIQNSLLSFQGRNATRRPRSVQNPPMNALRPSIHAGCHPRQAGRSGPPISARLGDLRGSQSRQKGFSMRTQRGRVGPGMGSPAFPPPPIRCPGGGP